MTTKALNKTIISLSIACSLMGMQSMANAATTIDVNIDVKHKVGGFSTFNRKKFMTIHSANGEADWHGEEDKKQYLLNELDVYFARETGAMKFVGNNVKEDPSRSGYADPADITAQSNAAKWTYNNNLDSKNLRNFEHREMDMITAAQDTPFYPGSTETKQGWKFNSLPPFGHSSGEFMGRFLKDYFGTGGATGRPVPKYVELMNEPVWPLVDKGFHGGGTLDDIFAFHVSAADEIKKYAPDALVGGFTTAFPEFEKDDFRQWDERWKYFMDLAGGKMDFYSLHLYDLPAFNGGEHYRSGANVEATLDMIEHYGKLSNKQRPFVISEYGAQVHNLKGTPYNPYRDWLNVVSFNSMLMQFLERPDKILKAVPFGPIKAEWGRTSPTVPYTSRMMRQTGEPESATGDWVWTDYIKFYEIWANVKGTRVDSKQDNINIQTDAYVSNKKLYVIFNNLSKVNETINLNLFGNSNATIQSVSGKHLYLGANDKPVLANISPTSALNTNVQLKPEATMVLEYTFNQKLTVDHTSTEKKYYATTYKQPIVAGQNKSFTIKNVATTNNGEAVLRVGIGRALNKGRTPTITVNGTVLEVTPRYRGSNQADKNSFFGMLEVPVPYNLLKATNTIKVKFADNGGHISSVALQVFNFSKAIQRSENSATPPTTPPTTTPPVTPPATGEGLVIEAERFTNTGSETGVDAGGYNGVNAFNSGINWVNGQDWVSYQNIDIPTSGFYKVSYQIAAPHADRSVNFFVDGQLKTTTTVPNTQSWSTYQTVQSASVFISAGQHNLMLSGGSQTFQWNLDKFELINQSVVVEAESFNNTGSVTGLDANGNDGVNATNTGINWVNGKDWVAYQNIQIPESGHYKIVYDHATPFSNRKVNFFVDGSLENTTTLLNTGSWNTYNTKTSTAIYIEAGSHNLMLSAGDEVSQWNLNNFTLVRQF